jgi:signal transduction histidine kinase/ligand-binding sensor domain-containing protein/CheY-like chemotaxis protein
LAVPCACVILLALSNIGVYAAGFEQLPPPSRQTTTHRIERLNEPKLIRFGPEQGLSKNISDLAVDQRGYLWVATIDGLARYDGSGFRHWRYEPQNKDSLPSNAVLALRVDAQDRLWVATESGLSVLGRDRRGFRHLRFEGDAKPCRESISVLGGGDNGTIGSNTIWIGTLDGAICRIDDEGEPVVVELKDRLGHVVPVFMPMAFHTTMSGDLWIGTDLGLLRLRKGVVQRPVDDVIGRKSIYSLAAEPDGSLLVGVERGFYRIDSHDRVEDLSAVLPEKAGNAIVVADGRFGRWLGTSEGLFRYEVLTKPSLSAGYDWRMGRTYAFADQERGQASDGSLLWNGVFAMVADHEGGLWLVGHTEGLAYLPPSWRRFTSIDRIDGERAERLGMIALSADPHRGAWLLSANGLYVLSKHAPDLRPVAGIARLGVVDPRAVGVCFDRVLIADIYGIVAFDPMKSVARRIPIKIAADAFFSPVRVACLEDREIIVSHYGGGIEVYSADGQLLRSLTSQQTLGHSLNGIAEIAIAPDGSPWYASERALFRWDGQGYQSFVLPTGGAVSTFAFSSASDVWVARFGAVERYRWDGRRLLLQQRVSAAQGLPDAIFEGLMPAADGNVWLSTGRGLALFDDRQSRVRLFATADGLPGTDFYHGPPVMLAPHRAVALSIDGLVLFDPERSLPPSKPSRLTIESLSVRRDSGDGVLDVALDPSQPVVMRADDRDLRIVPRLLSFSNTATHRYRSRLHGEDPDWVIQQGPGERVFSRLPQGRYTLEWQAANADGVWSEVIALQIEVLPPWWRSAWAVMAYTVLASALLWWLSYLDRLRLKRRHTYQLARQKRELAEQASDAKSRFLADLGHELRTPMTGVLGMSELLIGSDLPPRQHGQVQSIRRAGEHLLRLVDDALDLAKIEAGRLELQTIEFGLTALSEDVAALISPLAKRKGLRFAVTRMPDTQEFWIGDPLRLKQILLNLLGNAVKFTERGEVGMRVETALLLETSDVHESSGALETSGQPATARGELKIVVRDTGPGMDAEQVQRVFGRFEQAEGARTTARYGGTGLGLSISRELALAMGGEIAVRSEVGQGTEFELRLVLPLGRGVILASDTPTSEGLPIAAAWVLPQTDWRVILLVEDDPTVAEVLTGLLQQQGHRVVHAAHGLAALTEAVLGRFDLALIDLDLPGIDGCALAGQLRATGFFAPMLAITARADADAEPQAMAAGFVAFLRKPTTGERLREAIAYVLAGRDAPVRAAAVAAIDQTALPA